MYLITLLTVRATYSYCLGERSLEICIVTLYDIVKTKKCKVLISKYNF